MAAFIPIHECGIAILAGLLCSVGTMRVAHAEIEHDAGRQAAEGPSAWTEETTCTWGETKPGPVSWPDLIREIRETPVTQIEDGSPPLTINAHDIEEVLRIDPTVELPGDRH